MTLVSRGGLTPGAVTRGGDIMSTPVTPPGPHSDLTASCMRKGCNESYCVLCTVTCTVVVSTCSIIPDPDTIITPVPWRLNQYYLDRYETRQTFIHKRSESQLRGRPSASLPSLHNIYMSTLWSVLFIASSIWPGAGRRA